MFSKDKVFYSIIQLFSNSEFMILHELRKFFFDILNYYNEIYNSLNFIWVIPSFSLEDHSQIIQRVIDYKENLTIENIISYSHYILNEFFNFTIIKKDLDFFNEVDEIKIY